MKIKAYYSIAVDGKVIMRRRLARSYLQAFSRLLLVQMQQSGVSIPDTSNTPGTRSVNNSNFACNAAANTDTNGIVVGTGSTGVATTDYALQTKVAHGSSAGQLQYMVQQFSGPFQTASVNYFNLIRSFGNASGGTIGINEIGLYAALGVGGFGCMIRDVLGSTVNVANTQTLTVTYQISVAL